MGNRAGVAGAVKQNADYKKYHPGANCAVHVETKSIHG
jgi:hypothetical protein